MSISSRERGRRLAFTLLELVVVVMILATIAGLVIPQISMFGRSSDMAADAKNVSDVANHVGLHFALQRRFPQGMDSLLADFDADGTPDGVYAPEWFDTSTSTWTAAGVNEANQGRGLPISGSGTPLVSDLELATIDNTGAPAGGGYARSFTRAGFDWVFDHDDADPNSNNSATVRRPPTGIFPNAPLQLARVRTTTTVTPATPPSLLAQRLLPSTGGIPPANTQLVALGFGRNVSAVGKTLVNSPIYPGCDGRYYGRYVAVFMLYLSGERATLVGVTDAGGRTSDITIQQFNESLPDGSRQP